MRRVLLLLAVAAALAAPAAIAKSFFPATIPLPNGFNPEGISIGKGTTFYVGSIPTGAVFAGDLRTGTGSVLVPGATGHAATGLQYDRGLLWVSGASTGKAFVYNAKTGSLVRSTSSPPPAPARRSSTTSSSPTGPRSSPTRTAPSSTASTARGTASPVP